MAAVFVSWLLGVIDTAMSLGPWFVVPIVVLVPIIVIREAR
jgi:hypothetical protein